MKAGWLIVPCVLLAAGCNKPGGQVHADLKTYDVAEDAAPAAGGTKESTIKVVVPQIAYVYGYSYSIPADKIAATQERHIALCDRLGPARCHVLAMQRAGDDRSSSATLKIVVDASIARSFGQRLTDAAAQAGGKQSDASIEAEDLSKQIVDVEARLRSRQALADRLTTLLKTRNGPVADLVAAERAVADVQEEIDAAQSWLADARGRVATSTIDISYSPDGAMRGGFLGSLSDSLSSMGSFFMQSLSLLVTLVAMLLPWAVLGGGIFVGIRHLRRRFASQESPVDS